jgi:hypothetical protein
MLKVKIQEKEKVMKSEYQKKVDAIKKAIQNGKVFQLETYLGTLKVNAISSRGELAYTGEGTSLRTWHICSSEIERWYKEII